VNFFITDISEIKIKELTDSELVIMGLDIGDKTIGIAISDRRIKIAGGITVIRRKGICNDCRLLAENIKLHKIGTIVFGWPLQMNGLPGKQCEKILNFMQKLFEYIVNVNINIKFVRWDERFSTKVVDNSMISADLSRKKRKKIIDQSAAAYILQGAVDFLNRDFSNIR
jgi:putative Holliday junction resolvase